MSGGVDSSVAAALLCGQGYKVVGVYFKPWSPRGETSDSELRGFTSQTYCDWQQDKQDAMLVAAKLGIEFKTWDFSRQYNWRVVRYMIDGYRSGITPNPDVMCNKEIKFGLFLKKALAEGADYIATGHYARIFPEVFPEARPRDCLKPRLRLFKGKDKSKDQTYFLWTLTQDQLKHCLFPIGDYTKPEVRKLAKKFGLPNFAKKDSQGVCFVGELDMHDFLKEYIKPKQGPIYLEVKPLSSESGVSPLRIGTHDGAAYYTIGQRHGMNITAGGGPYYVVAKDIKKNIVYVSKFLMMNDKFRINDANWINAQMEFPCSAGVQVRYRSPTIPVKISIHHSSFIIQTSWPLAAVTPGQSAVIYRGREVLGGGIIRSFPPVYQAPSNPKSLEPHPRVSRKDRLKTR